MDKPKQTEADRDRLKIMFWFLWSYLAYCCGWPICVRIGSLDRDRDRPGPDSRASFGINYIFSCFVFVVIFGGLAICWNITYNKSNKPKNILVCFAGNCFMMFLPFYGFVMGLQIGVSHGFNNEVDRKLRNFLIKNMKSAAFVTCLLFLYFGVFAVEIINIVLNLKKRSCRPPKPSVKASQSRGLLTEEEV